MNTQIDNKLTRPNYGFDVSIEIHNKRSVKTVIKWMERASGQRNWERGEVWKKKTSHWKALLAIISRHSSNSTTFPLRHILIVFRCVYCCCCSHRCVVFFLLFLCSFARCLSWYDFYCWSVRKHVVRLIVVFCLSGWCDAVRCQTHAISAHCLACEWAMCTCYKRNRKQTKSLLLIVSKALFVCVYQLHE